MISTVLSHFGVDALTQAMWHGNGNGYTAMLLLIAVLTTSALLVGPVIAWRGLTRGYGDTGLGAAIVGTAVFLGGVGYIDFRVADRDADSLRTALASPTLQSEITAGGTVVLRIPAVHGPSTFAGKKTLVVLEPEQIVRVPAYRRAAVEAVLAEEHPEFLAALTD